MILQAVAVAVGVLTFAIGMAVFHAALVGAFEGNSLLIAVAAALFITFVTFAYLADRNRS